MPKTAAERRRESQPTESLPSGIFDTETCTLVLQGGGALGSYQAGVYEEMAAYGLRPTWVAGTSIGAINAAIIAGNPPERRVARLHEFWNLVTSQFNVLSLPPLYGIRAREVLNDSRAAMVATLGVRGFFRPRIPPGPMQQRGTLGALSYYDTAPLKRTLERLVDFDLINTRNARHKVRLTVDAVNVKTGNVRHFDSIHPERCGRITPEHIMASGALPPGFPPVEVDGEYYWDGGLVSNTPLRYVIEQPWHDDMLVLQVDLFSTRGRMPRDLNQVEERVKEIRYASRTRAASDRVQKYQALGAAARRLAAKLPAEFADDPDLKKLTALGSSSSLTILHMIYRSENYERQSKDYEFSRQTMLEHWNKGAQDVKTSFAHPNWATRHCVPNGLTVLDLTPRRKFTE